MTKNIIFKRHILMSLYTYIKENADMEQLVYTLTLIKNEGSINHGRKRNTSLLSPHVLRL